jgi:hypothetical protein
MDMRFGTWNVRSLYRPGLFPAVARDLARQKLDLVGVQEIGRDKGGTVRAWDYIFVCGKKDSLVLYQLGTGYLYTQNRNSSIGSRVC